jgi:phytanoyl-CoA hydroxylase
MGIRTKLKSQLAGVKEWLSPMTQFDSNTLPWIDRDDADIEGFLRQHPPRFKVAYNLADKLRFWKQNGYVILEQSIQQELLDMYWGDIEEVLANPEKYDMLVRIDRPEFEPNQERLIRDFPKEALQGKYVKLNDFHNLSETGKELMAHPAIVTFLEAIFNQQTVAMQTLTFMYGSQQPTHQDFPWVTATIPSHLAAAWIPLEDIKIDSGPLYYYVGSHRMPKFNFGNGILFNERSTRKPLEFADYIDKTCAELKYPKETLLIKRGDVLIWHSALAHGGGLITNPEQTRKSYVCHYSTKEALPFHRHRTHEVPKVNSVNGMDIYVHPSFPDYENSIKASDRLKAIVQ